MRRNRLLLSLLVVALTSGCSREMPDQTAGEEASSDSYAPPGIEPTAAPGVAFRYSYDFSLSDGKISAVQEAHASACEQLGISRCRITGLTYRIDDSDKVSASLLVKLEPAIARRFGKEAASTVDKNDGRLVSTEFTGEDEGAAIDSARTQQSDLTVRIAEIERRLAGLGPQDRERTELQSQLESLRREAIAARDRIDEGQERLATTPMTFRYYGEGGIAGFDQNPLKESWRLLVESGATMVGFLLKAIAVLLPWAILLILVVLLIRSRAGRSVRHWWNRTADKGEEQ